MSNRYMNKIRLWGVVWFIMAVAGSECGEEIKLWSDGPPGALAAEENDTPTLQIFPQPWETNGPVPAVLLIPGGGYKHISGYGTYHAYIILGSVIKTLKIFAERLYVDIKQNNLGIRLP